LEAKQWKSNTNEELLNKISKEFEKMSSPKSQEPSSTLFEKIEQKLIPAKIEYEDEKVIVFLRTNLVASA